MSVCDVPVISAVCDTVGQGAATLIAAPFDWLAQAMGGSGCVAVRGGVGGVRHHHPRRRVRPRLCRGVQHPVRGGGVRGADLLRLQLITGLIHRDPTASSPAPPWERRRASSAHSSRSASPGSLEITDQLAIGIVQATGNTMESIGDRITLLAAGFAGINIAAPGVGAIVTIFLAGLAISAAAIVWFSLLIRKALLLVAIVFAPIALAGFSWDATKGWPGSGRRS